MEPITRKEMFLAKAAGQTVPDLTPVTREEMFLDKISGSGGSGGVLIVHIEGDELDKTWQEIRAAQLAVIVKESDLVKRWILINGAFSESNKYIVMAETGDMFTALDPTEYPVFEESGGGGNSFQ